MRPAAKIPASESTVSTRPFQCTPSAMCVILTLRSWRFLIEDARQPPLRWFLVKVSVFAIVAPVCYCPAMFAGGRCTFAGHCLFTVGEPFSLRAGFRANSSGRRRKSRARRVDRRNYRQASELTIIPRPSVRKSRNLNRFLGASLNHRMMRIPPVLLKSSGRRQ